MQPRAVVCQQSKYAVATVVPAPTAAVLETELLQLPPAEGYFRHWVGSRTQVIPLARSTEPPLGLVHMYMRYVAKQTFTSAFQPLIHTQTVFYITKTRTTTSGNSLVTAVDYRSVYVWLASMLGLC